MIYELFGCPGCGKSTIAKVIAINEHCIDYQSFLFSKVGFFKFRLFVKLSLAKIFEPKLTKKLFALFKRYLNNANLFDFKTTIKTYLYQAIYIYHQELKMNRKNKNVVFDEGYVHHLISIQAEFDVPKETVIQSLKLFGGSSRIIFVDADQTVCLSRIINRGRKMSPMDYLPFEELELFVKRYHEACYFVFGAGKYEMLKND